MNSQPSYHTHVKVRYSGNHDLMRTVGFVAILLAVRILENWYHGNCEHKLSKHDVLVPKVRNIKKGGVLFFAPPCASWVFLCLGGIHKWYLWKHVCLLSKYIVHLQSSITWGHKARLDGHGSDQKDLNMQVWYVQTSWYFACCICYLAASNM